MLSSVKRVLIFLIIITVVAVLGVFLYTNGRTYYNNEEETGNTAGNLYNGGLFCEQDKRIYFSNDYDNGSLYSMDSNCKNIKKISEDKAIYINADDNYLYYARAVDTKENSTDFFMKFNNTGVYRTNHNGTNLKAFSADPAAYLTLKGNFLYVQLYNVKDGFNLYRYKIDASMDRLLIKDSVIPAAVFNNSIYYTGSIEDHNIKALDLSSFTESTSYNGSYAYPIFMGDYVYYIDMSDNYKIYRMNKDGSEPTLLVKKKCSTYNITNSGKYLYYQVEDSKKNSFCRLDLETMKSQTIRKGDFKQIHVTDRYVFFKDFNNKKIYKVFADGNGYVSTFKTK